MQEEIKEILDYLKDFIEEDRLEQIYLNQKRVKELLDYITNLQEENEYFNHCDEEKRKTITNLRYKIERLEEESIKLKELCDKYEEEHNNAFKLWTMKMEEMPDYEERMNYKSKNEKAIEYIEKNKQLSMFADLRKDGVHNYDLQCDADDLLDILKGDNK